MPGIPRRRPAFAEGEEHDPDPTRSAPAMAVTMYSTPWCGYCNRLKAQMGREGIEFVEVDIERDPEAAAFVESVNGGNQTVPTLLYPDGSAATNPSIGQVKAKLGL
jgi:mycoredoxin